MGWLDDAIRINNELDKFDAERKHRLIINNLDDIPVDFSEISSVHFGSQYKGMSAIKVLPDIIKQAFRLRKISICSEKVSWKDICRLNLNNIEELSFSLRGHETLLSLNAGSLKKLVIFGDTDLTPMELLISQKQHIDFCGTPMLEHLELRNFQQADPTDFRHLSKLQKLAISGSKLYNLDWLQESDYRLNYLYFDGELDDCSGVVYQPDIKILNLYHTQIQDVSPIEKMTTLERLDLRYGIVHDESMLRSMGIKEVMITRRDGDIVSIQREAFDLARFAVIRLRSENKQIDRVDELPKFKKKILLRHIEEPFEERIKRHIEIGFDSKLRKMEEPNSHAFSSNANDELIEIYKKTAFEYCPFLETKHGT